MSIRVFNADDHPMLRKGVSDLIKQTADMDWVGSAADGREALEKLKAMQPDVAILDIEMPHMTGLEVAKELLKTSIKTEFVLFTLFKEESLFKNAMDCGIKGYLLKESSEQEILDCIRTVRSGRPYVNPQLTYLLINKNKDKKDLTNKLSDHEINILKLIAAEKTSAEIANMLFISPKTVANHRSNISKKLNLDGQQNGLLKWALQHKDILT